MKILVTGATGFLGGWILEKLCHEFGNENVIGTGRNQKRADELSQKGFNIIVGDLKDPGFLCKNFKGISQVVHCAALSSPWGSYEEFYENNVVTTLNLLKEISSVKKFIYISTPSIYFDFRDKLNIKEDSKMPKKFVNAYAATKYIAEQEVLDFDNENMVRTVIRPRAIIGARDTVILPRVIKAYETGRLKIIGNGKNICDFSSAKNIAHAVNLALTTENDINGKIFNITDDDPRPLWPLLESTLVKLGFTTKLKKINYHLVFAVAAISELFSKIITKKEPVLTKYGIAVLKYSLTLDISEAKKHLGYNPIISTEESLEEFITYYKNERSEHAS